MKKKTLTLLAVLALTLSAKAQLSYAPCAGEPGSTAISQNSPLIFGWATDVEITRGYIDIAQPELGFVNDSYGNDISGFSLGDGGSAILTFETPITDGEGYDFMVMENSFNGTFLELAFVEVSSDGINYFRFPNHSETQTEVQISGAGALDCRNLNNLASKYGDGYGTPFDLSELPNDPLLNKEIITHVKLIDVVGSIDPQYATYDSYGNIINEPYPTSSHAGGFDFRGLGIMNLYVEMDNQETIANKNYDVYPNPAIDKITVDAHLPISNIGIHNLDGKRMNSQTDENTIHFNLPPGVYMVSFEMNGRRYLKRIIVK